MSERRNSGAPRLTELQLDALRELANIASGHAATALAQMLGTEVDLSVPDALALPRAEAIAAYGSADGPVAGVVTPVEGDIEGVVLLLIPSGDAETLCRLLGVDSGHRGRRLGAARDRKHPQRVLPQRAVGHHRTRAGALPARGFQPTVPKRSSRRWPPQPADNSELVLVLDSVLHVAELPCSISFLLLPTAGGVSELLAPLGLAEGR